MQPFFPKKSLRPTRASQQNTGFTNFHQNAPISDVYVSRGNLSHLSPATKALNVTMSLKHSCHSGQTRHSKISVQEKYIYYIHPCRPCLHRLKDILGILLCRQTICLIQLLESPSPLSVTTGFLVPFRFWWYPISVMRGSHGQRARRAQRTMSRRPKGPLVF